MDRSFSVGEILLNRHEKLIRYLLYAIVTWTVFVYFLQIQDGGTSWKTGDWLINYQAGFVRRGLIGEILYNVSPNGWLLYLTFFTQSVIYIAICHFVLEEFFSKERGLIDGVIIFSPAFIFLFPFYTLGAGMRKELIAFLSFVLLLEAIKNNKKNSLLLLSVFVFAVGVFSHEMIAFFVLFYVYVFFKRSKYSSKQKIYFAFLLIAISLSGIFVSSIFHGDIAVAHSICTSLALKGVGSEICGGAISALRGTMMSSVSWVEYNFLNNLIYFPLFVLAFLPLTFIGLRKYFSIILFGFFSILPLFFIAVDWGRWIYIYMTFLFFLYIYDDKAYARLSLSRPLIVFFVFYLISWRLPHYDPDLIRVAGAFMIPYDFCQAISDIMSSLL